MLYGDLENIDYSKKYPFPDTERGLNKLITWIPSIPIVCRDVKL